jgi:hypothetical protein
MLSRTPPLSSFKTQSLRSHSLYLLVKGVNLLVLPLGLRLLRIRLTQFVECFLDGKFRGLGHGIPHSLTSATN